MKMSLLRSQLAILAMLSVAPALAQGPIAYWRFNEGGGTTATDNTGNGNNGTFTTSSYAGGVSGAPGDTSLFANSTSQAVNVPAGGFASIGTNNQVTLSFWGYGDPTQQARPNTTVNGNNGNRIVFTHAPWSDGRIYWDSGNAGCCGGNVRTNTNPLPVNLYEGQWNHYAMVKNGVTNFSGIYINGNLIASTNSSTADLAGLTQLILAQDHRGLLDDISIYSRALSVPEIQSLTNRETYLTTGGAWNAPANWNTGAAPAGDNVFIGGGNTATVSANEVASSVTVGHNGLTAGGNGTLNINSGNLNVTGDVNLGQSGTTGDVNVTGNGLTVGGNINSTGANSINGGTVSASAAADRQMTINSASGNLAISSNVDLQKSGLIVSGAGNTTISGDISGTATLSGPLSNLSALGTGTHTFTADSQSFNAFVHDDGSNAWLLIGRGRQGWQFDTDGQGAVGDVSQNLASPAGFAPAAYSDAIVNDLLAQTGIDNTEVEIRLRRATNPAGTAWQEVRWNDFTGAAFTYDLEQGGAGLSVEHSIGVNELTLPIDGVATNTRDTFGPTGNDGGRVFTWAWGGHGNVRGFSYGSSITNGANNGTSFLWENGNENHAIPYTEVYIRALDAGNNSLLKTGPGTLSLDGNNTYSGITTIEAPGTLLVNGTHTGGGSYFVESGATLGGVGTINLGTGATVNVSGMPGIISPGPGYSNANPANPADVGTLTINASDPSATALSMGGILQLDIVDPNTFDILDIGTGEITIAGTPLTPLMAGDTAFLEINGTQDFTTIDFHGDLGFGFLDRIDFLLADDGIIGNFENFPENQVIQDAGGGLVLFGNTGTSLFIQSVPEPASIVLWSLLGLGVALFIRRRSRRA